MTTVLQKVADAPAGKGFGPFLVGLISFLHVNVLGQVYVVELVLVLVILNEGVRKLTGEPHQSLALPYIPRWSPLILYVIIVVQLIRAPDVLALAKGFLLFAFFLVNILGLSILLRGEERRIRQLVYGLVCAAPVQFVVQPNAYMRDVPWKFGFALPTILLACMLLSKASRTWLAPLVLTFLGVLSMALNARSYGGLCIASALILLRYGAESATVRAYAKSIVVPGLCVLAVSGYLVYGQWASSGRLGLMIQQKYTMQTQGDLGVLVGGRPELFYTSATLVHDPLIGHGYRPELTPQIAEAAHSAMTNLGYTQLARHALWAGELPTHSYLFGAWTMFGIVGALFWAGIAHRMLGHLRTLLRTRSHLLPLCVTLAVLSFWNFLFSPFGADSRLLAAAAIVIIGISATKLGESHHDRDIERPGALPPPPGRRGSLPGPGPAPLRHRRLPQRSALGEHRQAPLGPRPTLVAARNRRTRPPRTRHPVA